MNEWGVSFVAGNSPGNRVGTGAASLCRGTYWPLLARAMSGFLFRFCLHWASPTPLHSLPWSITDYLLVAWDFLVDIRLHHFPGDTNMTFIAVHTVWPAWMESPALGFMILIVFIGYSSMVGQEINLKEIYNKVSLKLFITLRLLSSFLFLFFFSCRTIPMPLFVR